MALTLILIDTKRKGKPSITNLWSKAPMETQLIQWDKVVVILRASIWLIKTYLIEVQRTKQDRKVCLQIKIH
jgi:hypothetical protein